MKLIFYSGDMHERSDSFKGCHVLHLNFHLLLELCVWSFSAEAVSIASPDS